MTIALALLACTGEVGDDPVETQDETPSPYIYEEDEPPAADLSAEEVALAVEEALAVVFEVQAGPVIDAYQAAMQGEQSDCPDYYSNEGNTYWYDYCYADDGTYFNGYGFDYQYEDFDNGDGYLYNGSQIYTVSEVVTGDGYTFTGGGSATDLELVFADTSSDSPPHTVYYSIIQGSFSYDGPEVDGTWLTGELVPDIALYAYNIPEETSPYYFGNIFYVNGGLGGLDGSLGTVVFDDVQIAQATVGSDCEIEPYGTVSVRDNSGIWYDVVYDGGTAFGGESVDDEVCDGCGSVWVRGEFLGDACSDFGALLDWDGAPW